MAHSWWATIHRSTNSKLNAMTEQDEELTAPNLLLTPQSSRAAVVLQFDLLLVSARQRKDSFQRRTETVLEAQDHFSMPHNLLNPFKN